MAACRGVVGIKNSRTKPGDELGEYHGLFHGCWRVDIDAGASNWYFGCKRLAKRIIPSLLCGILMFAASLHLFEIGRLLQFLQDVS